MAKRKADNASDAMMTLVELAHFLRIDEHVVVRMALAGNIPGLAIDSTWRFRRAEIEQWVADQLVGEEEAFTSIPDGMQAPLDDLMPESAIIPQLKARDGIGVIEELAARAYSNGWLADKPWFVGAVVERESLASTAMDGGVAFLHTRARDQGRINRPFIIIGRSWEGISFGAPDGKPTFIFFLLGLRYDKLHLPILGRLARSLRVPATIARLRSLSSPYQIRALLLREDEAVRGGLIPDQPSQTFTPQLDRSMRLRAIRRLESLRKNKIVADEKAAAKASRRKKPSKAALAKAALLAAASAQPVVVLTGIGKPMAAGKVPAKGTASKPPAKVAAKATVKVVAKPSTTKPPAAKPTASKKPSGKPTGKLAAKAK
ncbi:MAG: PTS sugar transporter subunit IIA [Myxococcales bacterium]|nr:PTS sugar transporter subunit IIA [Myxococcales bacterium]